MKNRVGLRMLSFSVAMAIAMTVMVSGLVSGGLLSAKALELPAGSTNLATGMSATFQPDIYNVGATGSYDSGTGVALQSDGRIVVAGLSYNGVNYDFSLIRLNANGSQIGRAHV